MPYKNPTAGAKPKYRVLANVDADNPDAALVNIGAAWDSISKDGKTSYISIILSARPWGRWDGKLQLHVNTREEGQ